jgi:hypothetical protein
MGPMYGIRFNNAHKKAITMALSIPKINKIRVYKIKRIVIWNNSPIKYLDNKSLIVSNDFENLFSVPFGMIVKSPLASN